MKFVGSVLADPVDAIEIGRCDESKILSELFARLPDLLELPARLNIPDILCFKSFLAVNSPAKLRSESDPWS